MKAKKFLSLIISAVLLLSINSYAFADTALEIPNNDNKFEVTGETASYGYGEDAVAYIVGDVKTGETISATGGAAEAATGTSSGKSGGDGIVNVGADANDAAVSDGVTVEADISATGGAGGAGSGLGTNGGSGGAAIIEVFEKSVVDGNLTATGGAGGISTSINAGTCGAGGSAMVQLDEGAAVIKSSLYRHFESKEEIWNAVMEEMSSYYDERFGTADNLPAVPQNTEELYEMGHEDGRLYGS